MRLDQRPPELPPHRPRLRRGGSALQTIDVELETITPIIGGTARAGGPRHAAEALFRAPEIAAQIRHWWRVLEAPGHASAADLYTREAELFGEVHLTARRSAVEVNVATVGAVGLDGERVTDPIEMYALWPARGDDWLARWRPGARLRVTIRMPASERVSLERALKAWILLGGYGGRTRRGCGSISPAAADRADWLPPHATRAALATALGAPALWNQAPLRAVPSLGGSVLAIGPASDNAGRAWRHALGWLRDFRQKPGATDDDARGAGAGPRPGRSRWPEPDKIRHLGAHRDGHGPRPEHGPAPAWPRSAFGLPIAFAAWDNDLALTWRRGQDVFKRLSSPLIVKPLALANGRFVPLALWMYREDPPGGEVVLQRGRTVVRGSATPFGLVNAPGDPPAGALLPFRPLRRAATVRDAFFDWIGRHGGTLMP